jgi:3,4-dihydroxy 2-butanone 4-phosphate synthase/GTP cyclohydrolase II
MGHMLHHQGLALDEEMLHEERVKDRERDEDRVRDEETTGG